VELTRKVEIIARIQTPADSPVLQEVSASMVAQEAVRQLREMADARGVTIRVADDLPVLTVDVGRLEMVFVNLLSNAIKYSDPGKPDRYVEVNSQIDGDGWCRIEVRDNGVGIPPHALTTIFQRLHSARMPIARICRTSPALASVWPSWTTACGGWADTSTCTQSSTRARSSR
jgi:signal transduction histidine kinase